MKLIIPDDIVQRAEVGERELRTALALQLYADNRLDHADACRLAHLTPGELNEELLRAGLSIQQYPRVNIAQRRRSAG
jgi:predicted HTH domain antitoxin